MKNGFFYKGLMRQYWANHFLFLVILLFFACNKAENRQRTTSDTAKTMPENAAAYVSSAAATENRNDTTHRFVRTAEMKFEAKNVIEATYDIEDIVKQNDGFVTESNLKNNILSEKAVEISTDSMILIKTYALSNHLILRVPSAKLDTTLKMIARNIYFLDYRTINAQDVALDILANKLTEKRGSDVTQTGTDDNAKTVIAAKEDADIAKVENLRLVDKIKYSTIALNIYQKQAILREMTGNIKSLADFKPSFGSRAFAALQSGFEVTETVFLALLHLWGVLIFGFLFYYGIKKYRKWQKDKIGLK